ncbi:MAG: hypothetical protein M3R61_02135 [Chloroflexota bacterium]|nr:hypothetical protein [Chloroflexota bacterium]
MSLGLTPAMVPWYLRLVWPFVRRFQATQSIERAAHSSIYAASSPEVEGVRGRFFNPKAQARPSSKLSYNTMLAQHVWHASAELTGVVDQAVAEYVSQQLVIH